MNSLQALPFAVIIAINIVYSDCRRNPSKPYTYHTEYKNIQNNVGYGYKIMVKNGKAIIWYKGAVLYDKNKPFNPKSIFPIPLNMFPQVPIQSSEHSSQPQSHPLPIGAQSEIKEQKIPAQIYMPTVLSPPPADSAYQHYPKLQSRTNYVSPYDDFHLNDVPQSYGTSYGNSHSVIIQDNYRAGYNSNASNNKLINRNINVMKSYTDSAPVIYKYGLYVQPMNSHNYLQGI